MTLFSWFGLLYNSEVNLLDHVNIFHFKTTVILSLIVRAIEKILNLASACKEFRVLIVWGGLYEPR